MPTVSTARAPRFAGSLFVSSIALAALCAPASAASVFYTDEATFLADAAAAGITLATEGFEGEPTGGGTQVVVPPLTIERTDGLTGATVTTRSDMHSDGVQAVQLLGGGGGPIFRLSVAGGANAIAFDLTDVADFGGNVADITLLTSGGDSQLMYDDVSGPNGGALFLGVISTAPLSFVDITNDLVGDAYGIDRVQFGTAVPEPTGAALFGIGLAFLAGRRRRNRRPTA